MLEPNLNQFRIRIHSEFGIKINIKAERAVRFLIISQKYLVFYATVVCVLGDMVMLCKIVDQKKGQGGAMSPPEEGNNIE